MLGEKFPNMEFFLVRIELLLRLNTRKYGPEKTPYLDTFHPLIQIVSNEYKAVTYMCQYFSKAKD